MAQHQGAPTELSTHQEQLTTGEDQSTPVKEEKKKAEGEKEEEAEICCVKCESLTTELDHTHKEKIRLEVEISTLKNKITTLSNDLEREVHKRCDLEQQFTEESKRCADQIEELIAKSDQDDKSLSELKRRFELYSRETSSMMENFTTNREVLTSQLLELRQENDYLLGKFVGKSRDLQNAEVDLPQTTEELQFHCLTLNEKLILATMAKEQLEETLSRHLTADQ